MKKELLLRIEILGPITLHVTIPTTIIEVAVAVHLDKTFHYRVPPGLVDRALLGHRVFVLSAIAS